MQDGKCPVFQCINHTSCNCNGNCSSDGSACVCDVGFDGIDCSIDLIGDKSYHTVKSGSDMVKAL